jgi:translation initiation factor IF-1
MAATSLKYAEIIKIVGNGTFEAKTVNNDDIVMCYVTSSSMKKAKLSKGDFVQFEPIVSIPPPKHGKKEGTIIAKATHLFGKGKPKQVEEDVVTNNKKAKHQHTIKAQSSNVGMLPPSDDEEE